MNAHTPSSSLALLERRSRVMGPAYRHFYGDAPLQVTHGEDVWLYDESGRAYLDCYNNVPSVGHCHPRVVEALARQAATLNTHTRYLNEGVVDYAEQLVGLFPNELDTVMFTCTGSEANDLALRIACEATGGNGFIVTSHAYHGVTTILAEMSPSLRAVASPHVRVVRAPDTYRSPKGTDVAARFANDVRKAAASLRKAGIKPAALLVDTVFSSDGLFPEADKVLAAGAAAIRKAGGIFIADEVQGGFGRVGGRWWAFQREAGLVPDMVTLGKPMGAGYPLAGVVMRRELVADFGKVQRYFNTFGGNTVAVQVGQAVLRVIDEEGLLKNADQVGNYLIAGLRDLMKKHPCLGDVRGMGLYVAGDVVQDPAGKTPDGELARQLVIHLRENGILINTSGPANNVLKIRPPLTFRREHADLLVSSIDQGLSKLRDA